MGGLALSLLSVIDNACHLSIPVSCYKDNAADVERAQRDTVLTFNLRQAGQGIKLRVLLPASPPPPLPYCPHLHHLPNFPERVQCVL